MAHFYPVIGNNWLLFVQYATENEPHASNILAEAANDICKGKSAGRGWETQAATGRHDAHCTCTSKARRLSPFSTIEPEIGPLSSVNLHISVWHSWEENCVPFNWKENQYNLSASITCRLFEYRHGAEIVRIPYNVVRRTELSAFVRTR